jgi:hypothetical protein
MPLPDPPTKSLDRLVCSFALPESVLADEAVLLLHPVMAIATRLAATNANPPQLRIERFMGLLSGWAICGNPYIITGIRLRAYSDLSRSDRFFRFFRGGKYHPPCRQVKWTVAAE